jgi:elongation factor P--(R)-beta-lysine ligase
MMVTPAATPWWTSGVHADRRPLLLARNRIKAALRGWLNGEGFTEVEAAILQVSPGNEAHLHGMATGLIRPDGAKSSLFLHTSPEFACKKLLAAGETRIFDFARVFRNRERGDLHAPEFTMLEWYRVGEGYEALMADCAGVLRLAAEAAGSDMLRFRGHECDPFAQPERLTLADAFARYAQIALFATLNGQEADRDGLAAAAREAGVKVAEDDSFADIFSRVLVERIEPRLGQGRATLLCEYPVSEAALARPKPGDPRVAERFELYACGVELANGFGELTDPVEQRRRFVLEMDEKERVHGERYPLDEEFLAALTAMPAASGVALGFDRLVMLATGAPRIDDVQWTPLTAG